jgi:hypothetical protein
VIEITTFDTGRASRRGWPSGVVLLAVVALLAIPSTVLAQAKNPTDAQYAPVTEQIDQGPGAQTQVQSGDPAEAPPSADRPVAGLPFTGLDIGMLAIAAALLAGSGLVLRRLSRAASQD